jgi:hypothetical protein
MNWGSYYALKGHVVQGCKAKGDHLDRVHSDEIVLEIIRWGRLVLVIRGQESQSRRVSGLSPLRSMVLMIARQEAGSFEQGLTQGLHSEDTQMRV